MKIGAPLGLTSAAAAAEQSLLPPDGTARLVFISSQPGRDGCSPVQLQLPGLPLAAAPKKLLQSRRETRQGG